MMNANGSTVHESGEWGTPGDCEAMGAYVLNNFCGDRGRREAQGSWFPTRKGDMSLTEEEIPFRGLQFAYDNAVYVHAGTLVDAYVLIYFLYI
jgi:hypothetical protein